jgi:methylenetetrahydrofolate dehydrogenase (NAD+)
MTELSTSSAGKGTAASAAAAAGYSGKLISAASIASPFQSDISQTIAHRRSQGKKIPKLVGILATPSPPSVAYAEWTKKACEQVGIEFEIWKTWQDVKREEEEVEEDATVAMEGIEEDQPRETDLEADVEDLIIAANADDDIHGIMVSLLRAAPCALYACR